MSFEVQRAVASRVFGEGRIAEGKRDLGVSGLVRKAVASQMAIRANDDGTGIHATLIMIAVWIEVDERSARRAIRSLEQDGILTNKGTVISKDGFVVNDFTLNLEALDLLPLAKTDLVEKQKARIDRQKKYDGKGTDTVAVRKGRTSRPPLSAKGTDTVAAKIDTMSVIKTPEDTSSSSLRSEEEGAPAADLFESKPEQRARPPSKPKTIAPHAMSEDWEPAEETRQYARNLGFQDWEIDAAAVECRDYWLDNPKTKRPGWERTFQRSLRSLVDDRVRRAKLKHVRPGVAQTPKPVSAAERQRRLQEFEDFGTWDARWGPKPAQQDARAA